MDFFTDIDNHRYLIGGMFVIAGILHFVYPSQYIRIMPRYIPKPQAMVFWSGVAELLGGVGIMLPMLKEPAAWGLIALLLAIFPANWDMFYKSIKKKKHIALTLLLFLRLPVQFWLIYWVYKAAALTFPIL